MVPPPKYRSRKKQISNGDSSAALAATATAATPVAAESGDLLPLILSRLPLRQLARCSVVCKAWNDVATTASVRRNSASRDSPWLLLHKRCWGGTDGDRLAAFSCRGGWFGLGSLAVLLGGSTRWLRPPDSAAAASGLVACAYGRSPPGQRAAVAVLNPTLREARGSGAARKVLPVACSIGAFECSAMWTDRDGYWLLVAGPISLWGSSWEVWVMSSSSSWRQSEASVDSITGHQGLLRLMCSVAVGGGTGGTPKSLLCIWGEGSQPRVVTRYSLELDTWEVVLDEATAEFGVASRFPFTWEAALVRTRQRGTQQQQQHQEQGLIVQVQPNIVNCSGRILCLSLRTIEAGGGNEECKGLELWELQQDDHGGFAAWLPVSRIAESLWKRCCQDETAAAASASASAASRSGSINVRVCGGGDRLFVLLDWGWRMRALVYGTTAGPGAKWKWLPRDAGDDAFSCRLNDFALCFYPNVDATP